MKTLMTMAMLVVMAIGMAQADDRRQHEPRRHNEPNYIIRRQQAYQVQGVQTSRLMIGNARSTFIPTGKCSKAIT